jgi:hypothetical protein
MTENFNQSRQFLFQNLDLERIADRLDRHITAAKT